MSQPNKSLSVAQYLVDRCTQSGHALTPMQLMKLVYIAHGYMLGMHGKPLLRESVQAWKYGPVVPSVYHAVKSFGSDPVTEVPHADHDFTFSAEEREVMDCVVEVYGNVDGITLSSATHRAGTPWRKTWDAYGRNAPISNDLIENFYKEILNSAKHSSL